MAHPEGTGNDGEVRVTGSHATGIVITYARRSASGTGRCAWRRHARPLPPAAPGCPDGRC